MTSSTDIEVLALSSASAPGPSANIPPFAQSLRAGKNSETYRAHSYHTKVPPEAIERLIRHHTREGQLVVDPFCGSGMAGVAAIRTGRHAILSDLSPAAVHIARNYTSPCDPRSFRAAVARVAERVRPTMAALYEFGRPAAPSTVEYTVWSDVFRCPHCGGRLIYWTAARHPSTGAVTHGVRCAKCRHVSAKRSLLWVGETPVESNVSRPGGREAHAPTRREMDLIRAANAQEIPHWTPQVPFSPAREMWRAGHTGAGIHAVADFYTRRNLHALAALRHAIQEEDNDRLREALMFAFTAVVNRASKRYQWNDKRPTNVMTGTLYVSSLRYEWNVWRLFERKVADVARYYEHLGTPPARAAVVQASATSLAHLPDRSVDYVFMDPPFGSNIFYADSGLLWDAWLGTLTDQALEIVVNKHRAPQDGGKTLADYQRLLTESFREVARVLKLSAYATLQFNNSSDDLWCALQDAVRDAGLEVRNAVGLDKLQPSIKGVKGRHGKEDVVALDSLIELRRTRHGAKGHDRAAATSRELREACLAFVQSQAEPATTDAIFAHLVRATLRKGSSLSGISAQSVKALCAELLQPTGNGWTLRPEPESPTFQPVGAPDGCVVSQLLASARDIRALVDPSRPALDVRSTPPRIVTGRRNTAFYNAHSYHTKVPPEAIVPFLEHFTRPGDVVLDPFSGSGMTGVAALLAGRRAILSDLSVAAAHLAYNHTRPCDTGRLAAAFADLARDLDAEFRDIYACVDGRGRGYVHYTLWGRDAVCGECGQPFSIWEAIDRLTGRMPTEVACPHCGYLNAKQSLRYGENRPVLLSYDTAEGRRLERQPTAGDVALLGRFTRDGIAEWYPRVPVEASREMFIRSALQLQGVQTVADFYTPRNLRALALLWRRVQDVKDERTRAALSFAFTNTAWHGTRMRRFNARGGQRPLTGTLYIPQLSSEANVLEVMRHKIRQLESYYRALGTPAAPPPAIRLASATHLHGVPDGSVDYVFTDPPFGSNIFYADCNLIWESWLGGVTRQEEEAVVNRSRGVQHGGKTVADYERLMASSMSEIQRVLKPGAWTTLVFHNTDPAVWRAIQSAAEQAGFEIEDAGTLDRKQQSHKGYRGRAEREDVAHFDVIMSMRKHAPGRRVKKRATLPRDVGDLVRAAFDTLAPGDRTVQRVHSEVVQRLAREGHDLGAISFEVVREHMPVRVPPQALERQLFD